MAEATETLTVCPACRQTGMVALPRPAVRIGEDFFGPVMKESGLMRCKGCGLEFVSPRPSAQRLAEFYDQPGYPAHSRDSGNAGASSLCSSRLEFLSGYVRTGRLLDFGCGAGLLMKVAEGLGWDVCGVDISKAAAVGNRQQRVFSRLEELAGLPERFDAVTAIHVLEHLPDPRRDLAVLRELISNTGVLLVEVPNIKSLRARACRVMPALFRAKGDERYRAFPIHLYGFSAGSLRMLLADSGFEVLGVRTVGIGLGHLFSKAAGQGIAQDGPAVRQAGKAGWKSVAAAAAGLLCDWFNLGENLIMVARPAGK